MYQQGVSTQFIQQGDETVVYREQDVEPIIDMCADIRSVTDGRARSGDLYHEAEIPAVVIEKYCNDHGVSFGEFMNDPAHQRRMLNDPANAVFRIHRGRV